MSGNETKSSASPRGKPFGLGHRGRPGRKKGARNDKTIVEMIAREKHRVRQNGDVRNLTTAELVLVQLRNKAVKGDVRAAMRLDRLREQNEATLREDAGVAIFPEPLSTEEWIRRAKIDDQFKTRPKANDPQS